MSLTAKTLLPRNDNGDHSKEGDHSKAIPLLQLSNLGTVRLQLSAGARTRAQPQAYAQKQTWLPNLTLTLTLTLILTLNTVDQDGPGQFRCTANSQGLQKAWWVRLALSLQSI